MASPGPPLVFLHFCQIGQTFDKNRSEKRRILVKIGLRYEEIPRGKPCSWVKIGLRFEKISSGKRLLFVKIRLKSYKIQGGKTRNLVKIGSIFDEILAFLSRLGSILIKSQRGKLCNFDKFWA